MEENTNNINRKNSILEFFKKTGRYVTKKALLLYHVMTSRKVPFKEKLKICAALIYFIIPLDLVSDFIPFLGFGDDIVAIAWALHSAYSNVTPEIEQKVKEKLDKLFPATSK